jgi:hypothetical protein
MIPVAMMAMKNWYKNDALVGMRHELVINLRIGYAKNRQQRDLIRFVANTIERRNG